MRSLCGLLQTATRRELAGHPLHQPREDSRYCRQAGTRLAQGSVEIGRAAYLDL